MSTVATILILIGVFVVLLLAITVGRERQLSRRREKARDVRREARRREVAAEQHRATAQEQATLADKAEAEARQKAAIARRERAAAHQSAGLADEQAELAREHQDRAFEADPDSPDAASAERLARAEDRQRSETR